VAENAVRTVHFSLTICEVQREGQTSYEFVFNFPETMQDSKTRGTFHSKDEVRSALHLLNIDEDRIEKTLRYPQLGGNCRFDELEMEEGQLVLSLIHILAND